MFVLFVLFLYIKTQELCKCR